MSNNDFECSGASFYCDKISQSIEFIDSLPDFAGDESPIIKKSHFQFQMRPITRKLVTQNPEIVLSDLEIAQSQESIGNQTLGKKYKCFSCYGRINKFDLQQQQTCQQCGGYQYIDDFHPFTKILERILNLHENNQIYKGKVRKGKQKFPRKLNLQTNQNRSFLFGDHQKQQFIGPSFIKKISEQPQDQDEFLIQQKPIQLIKKTSKSSTNESRRPQNSLVDLATSDELLQDLSSSQKQAMDVISKDSSPIVHTNNFKSQQMYIKYPEDLLPQYDMDCSIQLHYKEGNESPYNQNSDYSIFPAFLNSSKYLHQQYLFNDYQCDICKITPIKRIRYHCQRCQNYDLCSICYTYRVKEHEHREFQIVKACQSKIKQRDNMIRSIKFSNNKYSSLIM